MRRWSRKKAIKLQKFFILEHPVMQKHVLGALTTSGDVKFSRPGSALHQSFSFYQQMVTALFLYSERDVSSERII